MALDNAPSSTDAGWSSWQLVARDDGVRPARQVLQDFEIAVGEIEFRRFLRGSSCAEVDRHIAKHQACAEGPRPPQHGVDAREQFLELERLGDVVVRAELHAADLAVHVAHRRQQDDRQITSQ